MGDGASGHLGFGSQSFGTTHGDQEGGCPFPSPCSQEAAVRVRGASVSIANLVQEI